MTAISKGSSYQAYSTIPDFVLGMPLIYEEQDFWYASAKSLLLCFAGMDYSVPQKGSLCNAKAWYLKW